MLRCLVDVVLNSNGQIKEGALFCDGITIDAEIEKCINFLEQNSIIENSDYENKQGEVVNLELSLARLNSIGYYQSVEVLVLKNKYTYPDKLFYVGDLSQFSDEQNTEFYTRYKAVLSLIDAVKLVSKHTYTDVDEDNALIFRDDRSVIIPFIYRSKQVSDLSISDIEHITSLVSTLEDSNSEKKLLFINELIDFLIPVTENLRFKFLLSNIETYAEKCSNAYQYYLRDFSYNKLKIELDSKALEFTQKIQTVINDSQTKLIAIPTAFILVFTAFDFKELDSVKNIIAIVSLFIFAIIIQLFLNNQNSSLNFTEDNINSYKETFSKNNIEKFSERFSLVDKELSKQKRRLLIVTVLLWTIPASLLVIWYILYQWQGIQN